MFYVGIDFGTSNSCIAVYRDGALSVVEPAQNKMPDARVFPSCVAFDRFGKMIAFGWTAYSYWDAYSNLVVDQVKRWIGETPVKVLTDPRINKLGYKIVEQDGKPVVSMRGKAYTAEEIVTYLVQHLIEEMMAYLKEKGIEVNEPMRVIVTYPAYYKQNQVEAIREAVQNVKNHVKDIQLDSVGLIPEPTASICAALYEKKLAASDRYVMIIDEGAGTLDTLLVDIQNMGAGNEVVAKGITIGGRAMLGGTDMDNNIMKWVLEQLKDNDLFNQEKLDKIDRLALRKECENAKIAVSSGNTPVAQIKIKEFARIIEMDENKLNELAAPTIELCKQSILESLDNIEKNHKIRRGEITKVILVGGPTRMKAFRNMVRSILGAEVVEMNEMECVAVGAAVSPQIKYKIPAERKYGLIKTMQDSEEFVTAIEKDTPLPDQTVIRWETRPLENIDIEVAQVIEEHELDEQFKEVTCLSMGRYTFAVSPIAKTYYIAFRIDEERNVAVVVFNSEEKANKFLEGKLDSSAGEFSLGLRREVSARAILVQKPSVKMERIRTVLARQAPGVVYTLSNASEQVGIADQIIGEFGNKDPDLAELYNKKLEVENSLSQISGNLDSLFQGQDMKDEAAVAGLVKKFVSDNVGSDDYRQLPLKTKVLATSLKRIMNNLVYDKGKIDLLVNRISDRKNDAMVKLRNREGNGVSPEIMAKIEALLGELDNVQNFLCSRNVIHVNSIEGQMFRSGQSKEQELKCMIDQYVSGD